MKRDYRQSTTLHQQLLGRDEPAIELTKLVIDGDPQSLEGPSCRVLPRLGFWHGGTHDSCELDGTSNGAAMLCRGDCAGNPAGKAFFAIFADQRAQLPFGQGSNQIRGAWDLAAHPHIEGPVKTKRETALGRIELRRGNAQIEGDAGNRPDGHRGK
jgi:hypothetical protein